MATIHHVVFASYLVFLMGRKDFPECLPAKQGKDPHEGYLPHGSSRVAGMPGTLLNAECIELDAVVGEEG